MSLRRSAFASAAVLPLVVVATVSVAPVAYAAVDAATFSGTFSTTCTLPYSLEGPVDGPYACRHTATSVACAAVADTGPVVAYAKLCRADLLSGATSGSAGAVWPPYAIWTCQNGAGSGTFRYQPSTAESVAFSFPVSLAVVGSNVVVSGSYTQAGTGRHIVVRAQFPAVCASATNGPGYAGTISAV